MGKVFSFFAFGFGTLAGVYLPVELLAEFSDTGYLHSVLGLWAGMFLVSTICGILSEKAISGFMITFLPMSVSSGAVFLLFGVQMLYGAYESCSFMVYHEVVFRSLSTQSMFGYIFTFVGLVILVLFAIAAANLKRKMKENNID